MCVGIHCSVSLWLVYMMEWYNSFNGVLHMQTRGEPELYRHSASQLPNNKCAQLEWFPAPRRFAQSVSRRAVAGPINVPWIHRNAPVISTHLRAPHFKCSRISCTKHGIYVRLIIIYRMIASFSKLTYWLLNVVFHLQLILLFESLRRTISASASSSYSLVEFCKWKKNNCSTLFLIRNCFKKR